MVNQDNGNNFESTKETDEEDNISKTIVDVVPPTATLECTKNDLISESDVDSIPKSTGNVLEDQVPNILTQRIKLANNIVTGEADLTFPIEGSQGHTHSEGILGFKNNKENCSITVDVKKNNGKSVTNSPDKKLLITSDVSQMSPNCITGEKYAPENAFVNSSECISNSAYQARLYRDDDAETASNFLQWSIVTATQTRSQHACNKQSFLGTNFKVNLH